MTEMKLSERLRQTYMGIELIIRWADEVAQLEAEVERLQELRNELVSLYDENEPHDMGGPHISLLWVIDKMDDALEAGGE